MATPGTPASAAPDSAPPGAWQVGDAAVREPLEFPEIVIAPAHPGMDSRSQQIVFELRESANSAAVLPVFSSVRRLVEALGRAQPWVALPLTRIRELAAAGGIHTVMLDPEVQLAAWRWRYDDLENLPGSTE
jgi:hypothetical protein